MPIRKPSPVRERNFRMGATKGGCSSNYRPVSPDSAGSLSNPGGRNSSPFYLLTSTGGAESWAEITLSRMGTGKS